MPRVYLTPKTMDRLAANSIAHEPLAKFNPARDSDGNTFLDDELMNELARIARAGETLDDTINRLLDEH